MNISGTVDARRRMLADWYLAAVARHDRVLRSERVRQVVRVGGRLYYVKGEQLQNALDTAYHELHVAFGRRESWGMGPDGRPSPLAVAGLAQRRLRARLIDQFRRSEHTLDLVGLSSTEEVFQEGKPDVAGDPADRVIGGVFAELSHESTATRAAVLLSAAGFTAGEIASQLEIAPASVRQRTSRFARRLRAAQQAA